MKKTIVLSIAGIVAIVSMSLDIHEVHEGKGIAGFTESPEESNCTYCHSDNSVNTGGGAVTIASPSLQLANWQYIPGKTYTINVTIAKIGALHFGFGLEVLNGNNQDAGTLIVTDALTHTQKTAKNRTNIMHTNGAGIAPNMYTYTFNWLAPATNIGAVTFYLAGNAGDNDQEPVGDYVYTTTKISTPATVGVEENLVSNINVGIFPNPTADKLYITNSVNPSGKMDVGIYNINGKLMLKNINLPSASAMEISSLPKGNYTAVIETTSEIITKKFVKN